MFVNLSASLPPCLRATCHHEITKGHRTDALSGTWPGLTLTLAIALAQVCHFIPGQPSSRTVKFTFRAFLPCIASTTLAKGTIEEANKALRKALSGSSEQAYCYRPSPADKTKQRERDILRRLKCRANNSRQDILSEFATDPADIFEMSPVRLFDDPEKDWRLLLTLFQPSDTIWIGDVYQSGEGCERNFRAVTDWLLENQPPGNFTCPSIFKPGVFSRSKENVNARPFLVIESDTLTKPEICAVFLWTAQFLPLRAVVDTAGKSLHGWFDFPQTSDIETELKIILPAIGCDPAMFKASQPCRLPGAKRDNKTQALHYLNPKY